jgi:hypothetical protein
MNRLLPKKNPAAITPKARRFIRRAAAAMPSVHTGVTIDQLIAEKYGRDTILVAHSVGRKTPPTETQLGLAAARTQFDSVAECHHTASTEINPRVAFSVCSVTGQNQERMKDANEAPAFPIPGRELYAFRKDISPGDRTASTITRTIFVNLMGASTSL